VIPDYSLFITWHLQNKQMHIEMKYTLKYLILAMFVVAFASCDKENLNPEDDEKLPFSPLTEEENKELVENSAISVAKNFDELKDQAAIEASVSMVGKLEMANPLDSKMMKKSKVTSVIEVMAGLDLDESSVNDVFQVMGSTSELEDGPETIQEVWDEVVGTYTWNASMEDWDYTANANAIVFKFPSTENGTSNNATLTISDYKGITTTNPLDDEYSGDLPVSIDLNFDVDGTSVLSFMFAVEYNSEGIPTKLAADLTIEAFKFSSDASKNETEVSANYSFTKNDDIIMEIKGNVKGDFTQENIDANTHTHTETYEWTNYVWNEDTQTVEEVTVTETDEWEELDAEEVFNSGSFKFQLYNISISGYGDIKAMGDAYDLIYPDNYWDNQAFDYQAAADAEAAAMNEHLSMFAIDEESENKIADVEAYVAMDTGDGYTEYYMDFRLVYGDGSLVDLETYFEQGFEDFIAEINGMIDDMNSKFNWDLDHMDY
jgi:hypothetical protein